MGFLLCLLNKLISILKTSQFYLFHVANSRLAHYKQKLFEIFGF